ncbi:MAG TPA: pyridoxamine 5'-phosphate oxidase family protein [Candidatus Acidoferrum sp.]|nr:pyridoxamine 5'-phosphate oxidase family protein [Candidatus Acidoferrum sp.]
MAKAPSKPKASRPHMPGYGLLETKKGLLPWKWAEERLRKSHNFWIATVRRDGRPHMMVIWGLWLGGAIYFSTGSESRKAKNLAGNAQCVMGTEKAHEAVVVEGTAERVTNEALLKKILRLYERKYRFDMRGFEKDILALKEPIFALRPRVAFGLDEKRYQASATRWEFPAS